MLKQFSIYKCKQCDSILEILSNCETSPKCCDLFEEFVPNTVEASKEKHMPAIMAHEGGTKVVVGSDPHAMTEEHYIEWIEVLTKDGLHIRKFLKPGDAPEVFVNVPLENVICAREYCNLHGLWLTLLP